MNSQRLHDDFITDGRAYMAVQLADEIAAREPDASAYDCAEKAVRKVFGRWLLDHTAAVRPDLLPHYVRLVDRVEQSLGLHRRRRPQVLPTEPALGQIPVCGGHNAGMSVPLAV
jgi:hypothetical protein